MDELKPVAWMYGFYGQPMDRFLPTFERLKPLQPGWTETPLYDPATLLAAIGKALEAAVGVCGSGKNEAWSYDSCWGAEQVRKNILALDPATILAGLTAEAQADG